MSILQIVGIANCHRACTSESTMHYLNFRSFIEETKESLHFLTRKNNDLLIHTFLFFLFLLTWEKGFELGTFSLEGGVSTTKLCLCLGRRGSVISMCMHFENFETEERLE